MFKENLNNLVIAISGRQMKRSTLVLVEKADNTFKSMTKFDWLINVLLTYYSFQTIHLVRKFFYVVRT